MNSDNSYTHVTFTWTERHEKADRFSGLFSRHFSPTIRKKKIFPSGRYHFRRFIESTTRDAIQKRNKDIRDRWLIYSSVRFALLPINRDSTVHGRIYAFDLQSKFTRGERFPL